MANKETTEHEYFDSKAKRDWIAKNTRNLVVKINRNTDADIFNFLETLEGSYASMVKQAVREYMTNHPED